MDIKSSVLADRSLKNGTDFNMYIISIVGGKNCPHLWSQTALQTLDVLVQLNSKRL